MFHNGTAFATSIIHRPQQLAACRERLCHPWRDSEGAQFLQARSRARRLVTQCCVKTNKDDFDDPVRNISSETNLANIIALRDNWVAVNKPPSILVHRTKLYYAAPGETYLVDKVRRAIEETTGVSTDVLPVQRLDRPTSGVMLFAIGGPKNASQLQNALQSEHSSKEYWAIAFGASMEDKWENNHPLRDLTGKSKKQRRASSAFEQLLRLDHSDISVVRARISTGRRHQIRRHLSNSRHPIVGDTSYGKGPMNRMARELYGVSRCCLHSRRVSFIDPATHSRVVLEAPVPPDLRKVLTCFPDYVKKDEHKLDLGTLG